MNKKLEPPESAQTLDGQKDYREALNTVLRLATREICIFDYNLEGAGYDTAQRYELLRAFFLSSRAATARIVVHDPSHLIRYGARLQNLLRQFSASFFIHQTNEEAQGVYDPFVVVDTRHYVRRFHYESPQGVLGMNDSATGELLKRRFEEIWGASIPTITATTLGL